MNRWAGWLSHQRERIAGREDEAILARLRAADPNASIEDLAARYREATGGYEISPARVRHLLAGYLDSLMAAARGINRAPLDLGEPAAEPQPTRNPTGYRGVVQYQAGGLHAWRALAMIAGRRYSRAPFATVEEAARAYDRLLIEHGGDLRKLNFPEAAGAALAGTR